MDAGVVIVGLGFVLAAWDVGRRVQLSRSAYQHLSDSIDIATKLASKTSELVRQEAERTTLSFAGLREHVDARFKELEDADKNLSEHADARFKELADADKNLSNKVNSTAQRRSAWGR